MAVMCLLLRMEFFHGFSHDPLARNKLGSRRQNLCEKKKRENLSYKGALQTVEDLCLEEGWKREEASAEFTHESYESVLRRPSEELNESGNGFF